MDVFRKSKVITPCLVSQSKILPFTILLSYIYILKWFKASQAHIHRKIMCSTKCLSFLTHPTVSLHHTTEINQLQITKSINNH